MFLLPPSNDQITRLSCVSEFIGTSGNFNFAAARESCKSKTETVFPIFYLYSTRKVVLNNALMGSYSRMLATREIGILFLKLYVLLLYDSAVPSIG